LKTGEFSYERESTMARDQTDDHDFLRRLPAENYRGRAFVHWSMTIDERRTGWLVPVFYYKFRELLTHTAFRYGLCCPIYCCMPDHIHLLWVGIATACDQRVAARYFRKHVNSILKVLGFRFQHQPYDHVLCEDECERGAFETVAEYIARNPERAGLVQADCFRDYSFTGCLIPGYPELSPWQADYWDRFWRVYSYVTHNGLTP
jgi:putative transposase